MYSTILQDFKDEIINPQIRRLVFVLGDLFHHLEQHRGAIDVVLVVPRPEVAHLTSRYDLTMTGFSLDIYFRLQPIFTEGRWWV